MRNNWAHTKYEMGARGATVQATGSWAVEKTGTIDLTFFTERRMRRKNKRMIAGKSRNYVWEPEP